MGGFPGPMMDLWRMCGVEPGGGGGKWMKLEMRGDSDEEFMPRPRYQFSAVEHMNTVYIFGGYSKLGSKNLKDLWALELGGGGGVWRLLDK